MIELPKKEYVDELVKKCPMCHEGTPIDIGFVNTLRTKSNEDDAGFRSEQLNLKTKRCPECGAVFFFDAEISK